MDYQAAIPRWLWDDEGIFTHVKGLIEEFQDPPTWEEADGVNIELQDQVDDWLYGEIGVQRYLDAGGSEEWINWARRVMSDEWMLTQVDWKKIRQDLLDLRAKQRVMMAARRGR